MDEKCRRHRGKKKDRFIGYAILMPYVIIFLLMIPYALSTVTVTPYPKNNTAEGSSLVARFETFDLIDINNLTGKIAPRNGTANVAPSYSLVENCEGSYSGQWTSTGGGAAIVSDQSIEGSQSCKITGDTSGNPLRYDTGVSSVRIVCDLFIPANATATAGQSPIQVAQYDLADFDPGFQFQLSALNNNYTLFGNDQGTFTSRITNTYNTQARSKKWHYLEANSMTGDIIVLGENWTRSSSATDNGWTGSMNTRFKVDTSAASSIAYFDRARCFRDDAAMNESASIIPFKTVTFGSSFSRVNFVYYGSGTPKLLFSCNNNTPSQLISTNDTTLDCTSGSHQLTAWINLTTTGTWVDFVNITTLAASDTTPPAITLINLTSEGGLGQIIYSPTEDNRITNVKRTNDTTPTFRINTDETATCGILDNQSQNYVQCTTTGSSSHTCTENTIQVIGTRDFMSNCTDSTGNKNSTFFKVNITDSIPPYINLIEPHDNLFYFSGTNNTISFIFNATDVGNIGNYQLNLYIDNVLTYSNNSYINNTRINFTTTISGGNHSWNVTSYDGFNNYNSSETRDFSVYSSPLISFNNPTPANNSIIRNLSFVVNITPNDVGNYVFEINGVNQSVTYDTTNLFLLNKTGLADRTRYAYKVYTSDIYGNFNDTGYRYLTTDLTNASFSLNKGTSYSFIPYMNGSRIVTQGINCTGQKVTIGCFNATAGLYNINISIRVNLSIDPVRQKLLDLFFPTSLEWNISQRRSNNTNDTSNNVIRNETILCGSFQSINETARFLYRFNNSITSYYMNQSNSTILVNLTYECPSILWTWRNFNGSNEGNITGFNFFNFTWIGDNSTNRFNITISDGVNRINSSTYSLANGNRFNASGISLNGIRNITTINITVTNVSSTMGVSQFYLDNFRVTNSTSNQSQYIRLYASCQNNYTTAKNITFFSWLNLCNATANTHKEIYMWADINLSYKGIATTLEYNLSTFT